MTLRPDWSAGTKFRRYLRLSAPLPDGMVAQLREELQELDLHPYRLLAFGEGFVLVPQRPDLERFVLLPHSTLAYAMTRRDPLHDGALVRALCVVARALRRKEKELGLDAYTLGTIRCDDCGMHDSHRSRRMVAVGFPTQSGKPCSPWYGPKYNRFYGDDPVDLEIPEPMGTEEESDE